MHVKAEVCHPSQPERCRGLEFLVDTGAWFCQVPRSILQELGITPLGTRRFRSFDSRIVERETGAAVLRYAGTSAAVDVIFGNEEDIPLFGVLALEALGYQVDPVTGELKPIELLML